MFSSFGGILIFSYPHNIFPLLSYMRGDPAKCQVCYIYSQSHLIRMKQLTVLLSLTSSRSSTSLSLLSNLCLWEALSTRRNWQVVGSPTALVSQYVSWPRPLPNSTKVFPFSRSPVLSSWPSKLEFWIKCFNTLGPYSGFDNSSSRTCAKIGLDLEPMCFRHRMFQWLHFDLALYTFLVGGHQLAYDVDQLLVRDIANRELFLLSCSFWETSFKTFWALLLFISPGLGSPRFTPGTR